MPKVIKRYKIEAKLLTHSRLHFNLKFKILKKTGIIFATYKSPQKINFVGNNHYFHAVLDDKEMKR